MACHYPGLEVLGYAPVPLAGQTFVGTQRDRAYPYAMSRMADRVEINPRVMMGKPVIRGTRLTVELLLRKINEGATEGDLLDAYPRLQREDIRAAIACARPILTP